MRERRTVQGLHPFKIRPTTANTLQVLQVAGKCNPHFQYTYLNPNPLEPAPPTPAGSTIPSASAFSSFLFSRLWIKRRLNASRAATIQTPAFPALPGMYCGSWAAGYMKEPYADAQLAMALQMAMADARLTRGRMKEFAIQAVMTGKADTAPIGILWRLVWLKKVF